MFAEKEITRILEETLERQGWTMPKPVASHAVKILVSKIEQPNWQPEPSYAEVFMQLKNPSAALAMGDTCWFTRAVFPDLGSRRGISSNYYTMLGQACYDHAAQYYDNPVLELMRDHFEFIAEIAYTAIWSKGDFRSMWD